MLELTLRATGTTEDDLVHALEARGRARGGWLHPGNGQQRQRRRLLQRGRQSLSSELTARSHHRQGAGTAMPSPRLYWAAQCGSRASMTVRRFTRDSYARAFGDPPAQDRRRTVTARDRHRPDRQAVTQPLN